MKDEWDTPKTSKSGVWSGRQKNQVEIDSPLEAWDHVPVPAVSLSASHVASSPSHDSSSGWDAKEPALIQVVSARSTTRKTRHHEVYFVHNIPSLRPLWRDHKSIYKQFLYCQSCELEVCALMCRGFAGEIWIGSLRAESWHKNEFLV